jgi:membrane peptidoglycan carboxypeptidase
MKPLIVRQIENAEGEVLQRNTPVPVRQVLKPATVDTLTDILTEVVKSGTGKRAAVPGYTVAGKTGTAQMIDATGGYSMVDHVASFVGFVPASRPALVILVSLEKPRGVHNEGGEVAAPVFAAIAERALQRLAIPPDDLSRVIRPAAEPSVVVASTKSTRPPLKALPASTVAATGMPSLLGLSAREASSLAVRHGLMVDLEGSGRVIDQTPHPGQPIEPGTTCRLTLDRRGWTDLPAAPPPTRAPRLALVHP